MDEKIFEAEKEKIAKLESQRKDVLVVLRRILKSFPEVCRLEELKHQIMADNIKHGFYDAVHDHIIGGPFLEVSFAESFKSVLDRSTKSQIVTFKHGDKILACLPKITSSQLEIQYYET